MKKFILSSFFIASFGFYVVWQNSNNGISTNLSNPITTNSLLVSDNTPIGTNQPISAPTPTPISTPPSAVIPVTKKKGLYNDGTYVGNSVFAYNDSVQVKVIISNSKITDIQFVKYPTRGRSGNISSFALPILKKEAIQAQNANINAVSGASYTSPAFIQSLASALSQAKA